MSVVEQASHVGIVQLICDRIWNECDPGQSIASGSPEAAMRDLVRSLLAEERIILRPQDEEQVIEAVVAATTGLGPLEQFLADPHVSEIMVNGHSSIYVERGGVLQSTNARFDDEEHLRHVIDRMLAGAGRRVDSIRPMADARLPDGSRVHVVIPPLAIDGSAVTIRRFLPVVRTLDDLQKAEALTVEQRAAIDELIDTRANVLVCGPTSSGKTTMLAAALAACPASERVVVIEDSAELPVVNPHLVRLETRPATFEAGGEIAIRDLVRGALRMRPDRIVVGEVRGAEAFDMVQAMHTGHRGCWSTVHAHGALDALDRVTSMALYAESGVPHDVLRRVVERSFDAVVVLRRCTATGRRSVQSIDPIVAGAP